MDSLGSQEIETVARAGSVFRFVASNRGTKSERGIKLWAKDAVAYYINGERQPVTRDGYISIDQINPGEVRDVIALGSLYFQSSYSNPEVRAFSERATLPVSFVTLKPSLATQIWGWWPTLFFIGVALVSIIGSIVASSPKSKSKSPNRTNRRQK